jgi:hypothetical protein
MQDDRKQEKKPALRIVRPDEGQPEPKPEPKSKLGKMLTAYADAIDRDIQLLLDL